MFSIRTLRGLFFIYLSSISMSTNANVVVFEETYDSIILSIEGQIKPSDYALFIQKSNGSKNLIVKLNSTGGSLEAAIKIGRNLRKKSASAFMYNGSTCASACVFVLMGAPIRFVESDAKVIIHRFYEPNDITINLNDQKKKYKKIEIVVSNYLNEMNIPISLLDEMVSVSSTSFRVLNSDELAKFRLNKYDPYYEEAMQAIEAKKYGITKQEYHVRFSKLNLCEADFYEAKQLNEIEGVSFDKAYSIVNKCREDVLNGFR